MDTQSGNADDEPFGGRRMRFHLMGSLGFQACEELKSRVAADVEHALDGRIVALLCEHSSFISVGRSGSRAHIRLTSEQLRSRRLEMHWVSRCGGCLLHGPGQLAVYVLANLAMHDWTVSEFAERLTLGVSEMLTEQRIASRRIPAGFGLWGRTGQLAAVGVSAGQKFSSGAFSSGAVSCGAIYLNVNPSMADYRRVDAAAPSKLPEGVKSTMSCLLAERGRPVKMSRARSLVVQHLAEAFRCSDYHLFTGHPSLGSRREETA